MIGSTIPVTVNRLVTQGTGLRDGAIIGEREGVREGLSCNAASQLGVGEAGRRA